MDFGFLFDAQIALDAADGDAASSWVQVAKTGSFSDPRYGEFKITLRDFQKWTANFREFVLDKGRLGLPADVDHSPERRGETEAVGWVKQLETRGDQLWARVDWNTLGQSLIQEKRYAYISPSYTAHYKDEKGTDHGAALLGIALTNRPFLQMATVNLSKFEFAASRPQEPNDDQGLDQDDIDDLSDCTLDVSEPERQAHAVVVKKIGGVTKHMFPIPPGDRLHARLAKAFIGRAVAAGHITEDEAAEIRKRADAVLGSTKQHTAYSHPQMELDAILTALSLSREALGVAADADEATVLTALAAHQAKPPKPPEPQVPDGHVVLSQDTVAKLTADAAAGAAAAEQLRLSTFESAFESAQRDGKVVLAQKDSFRELYDLNGQKTLTLLSGLQPVVNMEPLGSGVGPADLDADSRALMGEFTDTVTPMTVDQTAMRLHAAAVKIEREQNISYEKALAIAERAAA